MLPHTWITAQKRFQPPYCPHEGCPFHIMGYSGNPFYNHRGWSYRKDSPIPTKRFQCKKCLKSFSYTRFKLYFKERKLGLNPAILGMMDLGASYRAIGRKLGCSEHMIRQRVSKMAKWGYVKHSELTSELQINEPLVYDGLENFAGSQYDPNHINQAIGKNSLFIYDFNFAPLNRKGRMTKEQKAHLERIEKEQGRYNPKAIREASAAILGRLARKTNRRTKILTLFTDEHFQYERAIKRDLKHHQIEHIQVSSKKARNTQNELFAVNHSDLLTRQGVAAFRRETISFAKTHMAMIHRFMLFAVWKNYFRPLFVKKQKRRKEATTQTPAMELGVTQKILQFHEFFDIRPRAKTTKINPDWLNYLRDHQPSKRQMCFVKS